MCQSLNALPAALGKQVLALCVNLEKSWWLPIAPSSPTREVWPTFEIKSTLPGVCACCGAGGRCERSEYYTLHLWSRDNIQMPMFRSVSVLAAISAHIQQLDLSVVTPGSRHTGAGDSSSKGRGKNPFAVQPVCLSANVIPVSSPACCLLPILPWQRQEPQQLPPLLLSHSVLLVLWNCQVLLSWIGWNPHKTAGDICGLDFGVVWQHLFVHSLQMALQRNGLIHRGSLSSLCRCGFSRKSGIQQHVVKLPELSLVVPISRNSRQEPSFIVS